MSQNFKWKQNKTNLWLRHVYSKNYVLLHTGDIFKFGITR